MMAIFYVAIIIQFIIIIAKCRAFHFGSIIKTLPPDFPEDFKKKILDIYLKDPQIFGDPVVKSKAKGNATLPTVTKIPNTNEVLARTAGKSKRNSHKKLRNLTIIKEKDPTRFIKIEMVTKITKFLRGDDNVSGAAITENTVIEETVTDKTITPEIVTTEMLLEQPTTASKYTTPSISLPMIPMPPVPIPIPVPLYQQMPIVIPMKTYYEPVIHNHPPLYKIRQFIKEDTARWEKMKKKKYKHRDKYRSSSDMEDSCDYEDYDSRQYYNDHYVDDASIPSGYLQIPSASSVVNFIRM